MMVKRLMDVLGVSTQYPNVGKAPTRGYSGHMATGGATDSRTISFGTVSFIVIHILFFYTKTNTGYTYQYGFPSIVFPFSGIVNLSTISRVSTQNSDSITVSSQRFAITPTTIVFAISENSEISFTVLAYS